jgi:hypothetical protein
MSPVYTGGQALAPNLCFNGSQQKESDQSPTGPKARHRADRTGIVFHHEAGYTFVHDFRHGTAIEGNHRRAAGQSIGINRAYAPDRKAGCGTARTNA